MRSFVSDVTVVYYQVFVLLQTCAAQMKKRKFSHLFSFSFVLLSTWDVAFCYSDPNDVVYKKEKKKESRELSFISKLTQLCRALSIAAGAVLTS